MDILKTLLLREQASAPATPASGKVALYSLDGTALLMKDDAGVVRTIGPGAPLYKVLTSPQAVNGNADTYVTDSAMILPQSRMQAGVVYRSRMTLIKTAAGTANPVFNVRIGTAGTTADTARLTHTTVPQTAVADEATFDVLLTFRSVGSGTAAVVAVRSLFSHDNASTGFANITRGFQAAATSAGFDSTAANTRIGISINPGASAAWTVNQCVSELLNLI